VRDLTELPKAHLHVHLAGAARPDTYAALAAAAGLPAPMPAPPYESFTHFQTTISAVVQTMRTPEALERVTREVVEDAAQAGAVWVEPSLETGLLGRAPDGEIDAGIALALEVGQAAAKAAGIGFGLVVAANRTLGPDEAVGVARMAAELAGSGVVGLGLDGDETGSAPGPFAEAFAIARAAGLAAVPHAGELEGPAWVREAVETLGARRLMHGVRAAEDPAALAFLVERGVALDVCPTSNVALAVAASLHEHPLPRLLEAGVRCSVNADDPLLFESHLLGEYELCRSTLGLSDEQIAGIARTSIEFSGAPDGLKRTALAGVDDWLS
jgi:adenosine deaminase